jgi:hypothetical protein
LLLFSTEVQLLEWCQSQFFVGALTGNASATALAGTILEQVKLRLLQLL